MRFLLLCLALCQLSQADLVPKRNVYKMRDEVQNNGMNGLARQVDNAIDTIVRLALDKLSEEGFDDDAQTFRLDWELKFKGYLTRMVSQATFDIGDHKPLIQWLDNFYMAVEGRLGVQVCVALRISDIKTFNSGIPVVFHPCNFPMDDVDTTRREEYALHFVQGGVYRGVFPTTVYWVITLACMGGTTGIGGLACVPLAHLAETFARNVVAPPLANRIQDRCGN